MDTAEETSPDANPPLAPAQAPQPSRRRSNLLPAGLVVACILFAICLLAIVGGAAGIQREKAPIELVLDSYMQSMEARNPEAAYALFSSRARRLFPPADVRGLLAGNNYVLFSDYRRLTIDNINISITVNPDPDLPQGTVATVSGTVEYDTDFVGTFEAILEKEGSQWMLDGITVIVPPAKISP